MAHVAKWKHGEVEQLTMLLTNKKVIAIAEIGSIPAPQMQQMRKRLSSVAQIRSAKNSLITRALDEAEKKVKGVAGLKEVITGQSALIVTDLNPFKLYGQIKAIRTNAPAKGGETATYDIAVKAGDTPFKPGPIVGELQKAGIPAAIQEGKVVIKEDKILVLAGEKISADLAKMLTRLDIYPIELGITLRGVYEDGNIFKPDVLEISVDQIIMQMHQASTHAFALALGAGWTTNATIKPLLQKAHMNALIIALEKNILTKETVNQLLAKTHTSMVVLASRIKDALDEDLKKMIT